ncbi:MAG: ribosome small subunit-dependent GTPase A [Bacteroidota bacterium]
MEGVVVKSTGSWYSVRVARGEHIQCRIKGKFRMDGIKHTNPISVGDIVDFEMEEGREEGVIHKIHDRKNYIIRKASNLSKQTHILASNLDQAVIVASLVQPATSLGFIDRFLATAEAYHVPAIIVFNKSDLYGDALKEILDDTISIYHNIGYKVLLCSATEKVQIEELRTLLKDKTTLFMGHSGVGKSTLLNAVESNLDLKTGEISSYSNKGKHTTTFAEMFDLSFGGNIIDTPGIKELGVVDFDKRLVSHYFREMKVLVGQCKFNDCQHVNEPGCMVIKAVMEGRIREERYASYLSILNNEDIFQ